MYVDNYLLIPFLRLSSPHPVRQAHRVWITGVYVVLSTGYIPVIYRLFNVYC